MERTPLKEETGDNLTQIMTRYFEDGLTDRQDMMRIRD